MKYIETKIKGVYIIEPEVFGDDRGYFFESFRQNDFDKNIGETIFVQENQSKSKYGVLRGLHFQTSPFAQAKLVRVVEGAVIDFAVDLRKNSPTFGKYTFTEINEDNHRMFFVPRGFAHAFVVTSNQAVFQYKCDNYYSPQHEKAIAWNDPTINIDWKIPESDILISDKDKKNPFLNNIIKELEF